MIDRAGEADGVAAPVVPYSADEIRFIIRVVLQRKLTGPPPANAAVILQDARREHHQLTRRTQSGFVGFVRRHPMIKRMVARNRTDDLLKRAGITRAASEPPHYGTWTFAFYHRCVLFRLTTFLPSNFLPPAFL